MIFGFSFILERGLMLGFEYYPALDDLPQIGRAHV